MPTIAPGAAPSVALSKLERRLKEGAEVEMFKINRSEAARGEKGELLLVEGKRSAMRMWKEPENDGGHAHAHDYEVLGYALSGSATLHINDEAVELGEGDSWVVPPGAKHRYEISPSGFDAVEVVTPSDR